MGRIIYHIRDDFNFTFIKNVEGQDLDAAELQSVINKLSHLHKMMVARDCEQQTIKNEMYDLVMSPVMESCVTHYPCSLPFMNGWIPNTDMKRPPTAKRHKGVYFATNPTLPDLIKIGCSIDAYQRMKTLYHEYCKSPFTVLAFIETDNPEGAEGYIHNALIKSHHQGEWFLKEPALEWLVGFAS